MPNTLEISERYILDTLENLLKIPSPTGRTDEAIEFIADQISGLGLEGQRTRKGGLTADWPGESSDERRALTAHVDTLGAVVKEIKSNGRLKLSQVGGYAWNTIEGESCHVFTAGGERVPGSILIHKASGHIYGEETGKEERSADTMELRLDIRAQTKDETLAAGVRVGDFVAFDPRLALFKNGFVRSRHLDDKAGAVCILAALKAMQDEGLKPARDATLHFSNYEEVGHGAASGFPPDLHELVAVDMAVVGDGQESDEFHTTICTKDSAGPYHFELTRKLIKLAKEQSIPHKVDVYPHYGSDGEAYWRAGGDVSVTLIGPGVDASHNYERTHIEALNATTRLIAAYLRS
ncbi:MAG: M42 family metallopeptidase [Anaerolineales bacterium]|nr:M42 family metallopeptidase [Anaerolineales bacterium]